MALEQQDINSTQLLHVTVLFEFLTDLGTDSGDGHTQGVHGLDFGGLSSSSVCYLFIHLPSFRSVSIRPTKRDKLTALNHSLYDLRTRYLASLQPAAMVVCVSSLSSDPCLSTDVEAICNDRKRGVKERTRARALSEISRVNSHIE